jgi:hypothetical protein
MLVKGGVGEGKLNFRGERVSGAKLRRKEGHRRGEVGKVSGR